MSSDNMHTNTASPFESNPNVYPMYIYSKGGGDVVGMEMIHNNSWE